MFCRNLVRRSQYMLTSCFTAGVVSAKEKGSYHVQNATLGALFDVINVMAQVPCWRARISLSHGKVFL